MGSDLHTPEDRGKATRVGNVDKNPEHLLNGLLEEIMHSNVLQTYRTGDHGPDKDMPLTF